MPATEPGEPVELLVAARWGRHPGVLTVTARRVVFSQVEGVVRKRERTHWAALIEEIQSVRVNADGHLAITKQRGTPGGPPQIAIALDDASGAARLIGELKESVRARHPTAPAAGGAAERIVATTTVMFRCPFCRTVYPELDARCPSCGAPF